jgi:hypothetical protein
MRRSTTKAGRETLTLEAHGTYRLRRLSSSEYVDLFRTSLAIKELSFWFEYQLLDRGKVTLGEFYAGMKCLFGERGDAFDDWKCSFSFPLALDIPGVARSPSYVLHVTDFRGGVEHRFRKVVAPSDRRLSTHIYYPPDPKEFSLDQMQYLVAHLVGFQEGYYKCQQHLQEPFFLVVESNLILYGFDGKKFFEKQYGAKGFEKRRKQLESRLPTPDFYDED